MDELMEQTETPRLPNVGMDALTRAEIDIQISTAHAYPRSITKVTRNVASLVTMSKEAAAECIYSLPRGGKAIVGPSIRLAEILFSQWGNCTGGSRTVDVNRKEGYVEAEGVFHDLETNAKTVRRVRGNIKGKNGHIFSDDMIIVTSNAVGSKAFRNAVLAGVPRAVWGEAYAAAERTVRGDLKTLPERRDAAMKQMASFGLSADEVCAILDVEGLKDVGLDELVQLGGYANALKEGDITAEQLLEDAGLEAGPRSSSAKSKPKSTAKPKTETKAKPKEEKADDNTKEAEVTEEPEGDNAPAEAPEKHRKIHQSIMADIDDGAPIDATKDFYAEQLAEMKADAPEFYKQVMAEIDDCAPEKE